MPSIINLATTAALNAKIIEIKDKIPNISNLASTAALTTVENNDNLVEQTDYDTKINEIEKKTINHDHDKYITPPEFNKLTEESFAARLAQEN